MEGSPIVDLTTGEPSDGPVTTFRYGEAEPATPASDDLKAALELAGCESAEQLIDMALIGSSLMDRTANIIKLEGQFKDWSPMNDPAEIVDELYKALEHARMFEDFDRPQLPNFAKDCPPAEIAHSFACEMFAGVHMGADIAGAIIAAREPLKSSPLPFEALSDLVAFVRKIGRRATPDILAQQLVITKHRETAALTRPEEIGLRAFISVLLDLDDFAAAEQACRDLEQAKPVERKPVPIDETTMETVDGPMETWR